MVNYCDVSSPGNRSPRVITIIKAYLKYHSSVKCIFSLFVSDDVCDLKTVRPGIGIDMTAKERESLEENEDRDQKNTKVGNGEKGQEDEREKKEVKQENTEEEEEEEQTGIDEEDELELLRSQVVQLLLELEETREVSQRHEESYNELQGEYACVRCV